MTFETLLSENQYAAARGVCGRTIQRERAQRIGPPFIRLGRKIYYRPEAIQAWLLAKEQAQPRSTRSN